MIVPLPRRPFALFFMGLLAAVVCGCAKTGTVEGKATVDGKPATGATVIFSGGDNQSSSAVIQGDGTYQATRVPVGAVQVAFMPIMTLGKGKGPPTPPGNAPDLKNIPRPAPQSATPPPAIPKRYTNVKTSGLTLTVTGGRNEFNIEMTSP